MQMGYVTARVYTSEAEIPIEGAVFTVESASTGGKYLHGVRFTDENGKTTPVPVEAPDEKDSLTPGGGVAYATVDVRISHPDYITQYITGVQVFAGQVSVQQSAMIPVDTNVPFGERYERYDIPPSGL